MSLAGLLLSPEDEQSTSNSSFPTTWKKEELWFMTWRDRSTISSPADDSAEKWARMDPALMNEARSRTSLVGTEPKCIMVDVWLLPPPFSDRKNTASICVHLKIDFINCMCHVIFLQCTILRARNQNMIFCSHILFGCCSSSWRENQIILISGFQLTKGLISFLDSAFVDSWICVHRKM